MDDIKLPMDTIIKNGLTISEYLVLYDIVHQYVITDYITDIIPSVLSLEVKGFIKLQGSEVFLRDKTNQLFNPEEDYFTKWLKEYPTMVKKRYGGKRALSPASEDTILGKRLRKKWAMIFKKDIKAQEKAVMVLTLMVKDKRKSGDLEFMVEAARWLNEGFHEKYAFLVDDGIVPNNDYESEDYM